MGIDAARPALAKAQAARDHVAGIKRTIAQKEAAGSTKQAMNYHRNKLNHAVRAELATDGAVGKLLKSDKCSCDICYNPFSTDLVRNEQCVHMMCWTCWRTIAERQARCPFCRAGMGAYEIVARMT